MPAAPSLSVTSANSSASRMVSDTVASAHRLFSTHSLIKSQKDRPRLSHHHFCRGKTNLQITLCSDIDLLEATRNYKKKQARLASQAGAYGMEVSIENSKAMINSNTNAHANVTVK